MYRMQTVGLAPVNWASRRNSRKLSSSLLEAKVTSTFGANNSSFPHAVAGTDDRDLTMVPLILRLTSKNTRSPPVSPYALTRSLKRLTVSCSLA